MSQIGQTTPTGGRSVSIYEGVAAAKELIVTEASFLNFVGVYCWESAVAGENDLKASIYRSTGPKQHTTQTLANAITSTSPDALFDAHIPFEPGLTLAPGTYIVAVAATGRGGTPLVSGQTGPGGQPAYMTAEGMFDEFPADCSGLIDLNATRTWDIYIDITPLPPGMAAAAAGVASSSAALTTQVRMAAAASSVASSAAAISTAIRLAAQATSSAVSSGLIASGALLSASAQDVVTATAALTIGIRLAGQAVDTAVADGTLTNWATVTLSGALYNGPGGILDENFWIDARPSVGTTLYYDATQLQIFPNGEVSSMSNSCTAIVQFHDGTGWAMGLIVLTPQLAAVAEVTSLATAQLTSAIRLAAAAEALATASAAFSTGAGLAAAASDVATGSGSLTTSIPLSALATNVTTAVASLTTQIKLAASAGASSSADANLNGVISLQAGAQSIASAMAPLTTAIRASAAANVSASASSSLTTGIRMSAAAQDVVVAAGALSTLITMNGAATASVSATGDLTTARLLVAAALDVAKASAMLSTGINIDARAESVAKASAILLTAITLAAEATSSATASATLTDIIQTPPIGAYVSDPRYVIAKSRWAFPIWERTTPRFGPKYVGEKVVLTFDLSAVLGDDDLDGPITLTIGAVAGTDANPRSLFVGVPSYDMTKRKILQPVEGGVAGAFYYVRVLAGTSKSYRFVAMTGLLPVIP